MRYKHVILGNGNLGRSLARTLKDSFLWKDFRFPFNTMMELADLKPEFVWCAVGGGSVDQVKNDHAKAFQAHVELPRRLMEDLPKDVKLIFFSTDYVASETEPSAYYWRTKNPRSLYALTKLWMEDLVKAHSSKRPTIAVRVGSLYGHDFPERCFPYKILHKLGVQPEVTFPVNQISPTPTDWIAEVLNEFADPLLKHSAKFPIHHLAPNDYTTTLEWAQCILGENKKYISRGFDDERPHVSNLRCSFMNTPSWKELWRKHWMDRIEVRHGIEMGMRPVIEPAPPILYY